MTSLTNGAIHEGENSPSTVSRVAAWDWRDGPIEGLLEIGNAGEIFHFRLLEERIGAGDDEDIRVFGLYPVSADSFDRFVAAVGQYHQPRWPIWWPIWQFPSDEIRDQIDSLVDEIKDGAAPLQWIVIADSSFRSFRALPISLAGASGR